MSILKTSICIIITLVCNAAIASEQKMKPSDLGDNFTVTGLSGDGNVAVGTTSSGGSWLIARWSKDGLSVLGTGAASAVSDDGQTIAGTTPTSTGIPFPWIWTYKGGFRNIDTIHDNTITGYKASAISKDGRVVAGDYSTSVNTVAYRWTAEDGIKDIGSLGGIVTVALGTSSDGSVIVGQGGLKTNAWRGFIWTAANGIQNLGTIGGDASAAKAVSADGVVVGGYSSVDNSLNTHAFLWRKSDGMTDIGTLGGTNGAVSALSKDGSTAVGYSTIAQNSATHAFLWNKNDGMTDLGTLGGKSSQAAAVSADGSIVAGYANTADGKKHGALWKVTTTEPAPLNQGNGNLTVIGSIIAAPCSLATDSQSQSVALGQISQTLLQNGGSSTPKSFSLRLVNCDITHANTVSVTFTGVSPASVGNAGLALSGGSAKGAYITLSEGDSGLPVKLGEVTQAQRLSAGDNQMSFNVALRGEPGSNVIPGDFTAVVNFSLAYL